MDVTDFYNLQTNIPATPLFSSKVDCLFGVSSESYFAKTLWHLLMASLVDFRCVLGIIY